MEKPSVSSNEEQVIKETLKKTFESSLWVFRKLNSHFAFYYLSFAVIALFAAYAFLFPPDFELARSIFPSLLVMIGMAFAVFITPYYVKQYNEQGSTEPFKHFVRDNVTALVINHIKKFLLIFLYTLLLVIPGIIKCLRLTFVTQTTFFDKDSKEGRQSALKASQDLTKGFLFPLFLVLVSLFFVTMGVSLILKYGLKWLLVSSDSFLLSSIRDSCGFIIDFYFHNLALIFMTQLYFCLSKAKSLT